MTDGSRISLVKAGPALPIEIVQVLDSDRWALDHLACGSDAFETACAAGDTNG